MPDAQDAAETQADVASRDPEGSAARVCAVEAEGGAALAGRPEQGSLSGERLAHLAHELRTPLSAIATSAELIADERFGPLGDPRYMSYIAGIERSARHLLDVIELMLSGAQLPAPLAGTDLAMIAAAAVEQVRTLAEASRATITLDTVDGLRVAAEPTALRQMLINLLANALHHTGLAPAIVVRAGGDTRGTMWVEVEDDGPGIPPVLAAQLLEHGAGRANGDASGNASTDARASLPKGHGFGLAITNALARDNGAELSLHPVAPSGTRARLTFVGVAAE